MIVVGVVLLVLAVLATLGVSLFNGGQVSGAAVFGVSLSNVSVGGLFVAGVVAGVVGALGLGLMLTGSARKRHKKSQTTRQVRSARSEAETLAEENARLQEQLERERTTSVRPAEDGGVGGHRAVGDRAVGDGGAHDRVGDGPGEDRTLREQR